MAPAPVNPLLTFMHAFVQPSFTAVYWAMGFSSMLYGVACYQGFQYYTSSRSASDGWFLRSLVALLLMFDTVHQALVIHMVYYYLIQHHADLPNMRFMIWSLPLGMIFTHLSGAIVHGFLLYRLWKFSRNAWISGLAGLWLVGVLGLDLVFPIKAFSLAPGAVTQFQLEALNITSLSVSSAGDSLFALLMAFFLYKSRTGYRRSDNAVLKIITLTVSTGALTTLFELAHLVTYLIAPADLVMMFFNIMLSKVYVNSLLILLNSRELILGHMRDIKSNQFSVLVRNGLVTDKGNRNHLSIFNLTIPDALNSNEDIIATPKTTMAAQTFDQTVMQ